MQLTSGHPFWPAFNGFIRTYEPLTESAQCDVLIIGGGITGSLLAKTAADAGCQTIIVDGRNFGWGSTSASTALIQYEIDNHLVDLSERIGQEQAETAFLACRGALDKIHAVCESVAAGNFEWRPSYYFVSRRHDVGRLRAECEARKRIGLEVEWLPAEELRKMFDFPTEGAILSRAAGTLDGFHLTHALLKSATERGLRAYARTNVLSLQSDDHEVVAMTDRGATIRSRWAVVAAGYESLAFLPVRPRVRLHNTFAFATEPIADFVGWPDKALLWESARPYYYARTTADNRAIFGGADVPFRSPLIRDRISSRQIRKLEKRWTSLFPRIPLEIALTWSGTFAETADGLPYIGVSSSQPGTFFALCYGGNGITYSVIAAEMLMAALSGEPHPCQQIFQIEGR